LRLLRIFAANNPKINLAAIKRKMRKKAEAQNPPSYIRRLTSGTHGHLRLLRIFAAKPSGILAAIPLRQDSRRRQGYGGTTEDRRGAKRPKYGIRRLTSEPEQFSRIFRG